MFLDDTACNLSSINLTKFLNDDGTFDIEGYRHACRILIIAQEILVDYSQLPHRADRQEQPRLPSAGPRLRQPGHPADAPRHPLRQRRGARLCAGLTAILCGHAYRVSAEMAESKGAFPGYDKNRDPMLRVMRKHQNEAHTWQNDFVAQGSAADDVIRAILRAGSEDWDEAVRARREARLPQRSGHRARAHRHHRPAHGLRHHRHRARLRPGQVQEAGRRRLLQDRQQQRAPGPQAPGLHRRPVCRHRGVHQRHQHVHRCPPHQPSRPGREGPDRRRDRQGREGPARRVQTSTRPWQCGSSAKRPTSASASRQSRPPSPASASSSTLA